MATTQAHMHDFDAAEWPFDDPINTAAYTSAPVLEGHPILLVFHGHDGEWQFLHGPVTDVDTARLVCLGCMFSRDRGLRALVDMPAGWMAYRESSADHWRREPCESSDEGDDE